MMKNITLTLLLVIATVPAIAQEGRSYGSGLTAGANYRIHPSTVNQSEVFLVKSPVDKDILFAACNSIMFAPTTFISEGIYVTTDGGNTWTGSDTCNGYPIAFHGGDPGITIDRNGRFLLTRMGRSPFVGLYSHYSTDNGKTWSAQKMISTDDLERASLATDVVPASAACGRSYAAWVKFALPFPIMFSFTDDGAVTWSTPRQVNNPSSRSAGGDLAIGPNGEVYLVWAGVKDVTPFNEILVGFAASHNGGADWSVTENAFTVNGITGKLDNKNGIRVNGLPSIAVDTTNGPRRGWLYVITGQKNLAPAGGDPDVILYRSEDEGKTWSSGIRVNQDPLNNGKTQYFPNIHIDRFGAVNVIYYDDRNTANDSTGVVLARSTDGGDSWKEYGISDHNFAPEPIGGLGQGYQGDIIDLTSTDSTIWTVWMDNSTGIYQIWTAPVRFTSLDAVDETGSPSQAVLKQNLPNPFSGETTIGFRTRTTGPVSLKVYDQLGNEVSTLVSSTVSPGYHEALFRPSGVMANGVYVYRLTTGDGILTRKMIYQKSK
jgi:hypothetical protein